MKMFDRVAFGRAIKRFRSDNGNLTKIGLAKQIGINSHYIIWLEAGDPNYKVPCEVRNKVFSHMGISPKWFMVNVVRQADLGKATED